MLDRGRGARPCSGRRAARTARRAGRCREGSRSWALHCPDDRAPHATAILQIDAPTPQTWRIGMFRIDRRHHFAGSAAHTCSRLPGRVRRMERVANEARDLLSITAELTHDTRVLWPKTDVQQLHGCECKDADVFMSTTPVDPLSCECLEVVRDSAVQPEVGRRVAGREGEIDGGTDAEMAHALLEADADAGPDVLAGRGGVRDASIAAPLHLCVAGDGELGRDIAASVAEQLFQRESELEAGEARAGPGLETEEALGHVADRSPGVSVGSEGVAEVGAKADPRSAQRAPAGAAAEIDDVAPGRGAEERDGGGGGERDLHGRAA